MPDQSTYSLFLPEIGTNGNWYINGIDTGKPSKGEDVYKRQVSGKSCAGRL